MMAHPNFTEAAVSHCPLGVLFWGAMEYVACHMLHYRTIHDACTKQRELLEEVLLPATQDYDVRLDFGYAGISQAARIGAVERETQFQEHRMSEDAGASASSGPQDDGQEIIANHAAAERSTLGDDASHSGTTTTSQLHYHDTTQYSDQVSRRRKMIPQSETLTLAPLMYTRWPVFHVLLQSQVWRQPYFADIYYDRDINCLRDRPQEELLEEQRHEVDITSESSSERTDNHNVFSSAEYTQRADPRTALRRIDAVRQAVAEVQRHTTSAEVIDKVLPDVFIGIFRNLIDESAIEQAGAVHDLSQGEHQELVENNGKDLLVPNNEQARVRTDKMRKMLNMTRYDSFRRAFNNYDLQSSLHFFWQDDWTHSSMEFAFTEWISQRANFEQVGRECLWSYVVANLFKNYVCLQTETKCSEMFLPLIELSLTGALKDAPKLRRALNSDDEGFARDDMLQMVDRQYLCNFECLFASMWPVSSFLWLTASMTLKHSFSLDFSEDWLFGRSAKLALLTGDGAEHFEQKSDGKESTDGDIHQKDRDKKQRLLGLRREFFSSQDNGFLQEQFDEAVQTVYVTMVWGSLYGKYVPHFCEHLRTILAEDASSDFAVFAHDDVSYRSCVQASAAASGIVPGSEHAAAGAARPSRQHGSATSATLKGRCFRGYSKALGKFSLSLVLLQLGYDVLYLDFDTYLLRNPTPFLRHLTEGNNNDVEMLVGGSIFDDCINNGVYYLRSTLRTQEWLGRMFKYLYDRPYLVDQKCFSAFLGSNAAYERVPEEVGIAFAANPAVYVGTSVPSWQPIDPYRYWAHSHWFVEQDKEATPPDAQVDDVGTRLALFAFHFEKAAWLDQVAKDTFGLDDDSKRERMQSEGFFAVGAEQAAPVDVRSEQKFDGAAAEHGEVVASSTSESISPDHSIPEFEMFYVRKDATEIRRFLESKKLTRLPETQKTCVTLPQQEDDIPLMVRKNRHGGRIPEYFPIYGPEPDIALAL
ncbi:unnamed protein product [Amoebophrya sp. A120]|nr:unnamed protein product [Amoebophrya sp. A120]|eukprot:GSA120T00021605001.1